MSAAGELADLQVSVDRVQAHQPRRRGWWRLTFVVHNTGAEDIQLREAWLPHSLFRGPDRVSLSVALRPGDAFPLVVSVRVDESPLTTVENAFLILRVTDASVTRRVFVRLRVPIDAQGVPHPEVDHVSSQVS